MPVATRRKNSVLGELRTLFNVGAIGEMTDGQLLERFATGGVAAELAFAALVERHGVVVLQTCRSILRDEHEAEDAFQATFLVLVRKAGSLWMRDSLGPWLHQVAYRAAMCSRSATARRTVHERRAAEMIAGRDDGGMADDGKGADLGAAIHAEIERLPERFRVPIVLCDLEGRTHEQAARHLGCPVGTIKSRLARGRLRLRDRLTRRGLTVPAGIVVARLQPRTTWAAPAASWVESTTRAAMQIAAGRPLPGAISPAVVAVIRESSMGLFRNSSKRAALAVVTLGALAAGLVRAGLLTPTGDPENPARIQTARAAAGAQVPRNEGPRPEARDTVDFRGQWQVLYVAGPVAGKREGYPTPDLTVRATDKTIELPTLTGNPKDPASTVGATSYTLYPGLKEADEQVESAQERLEWNRIALHRLRQAASTKPVLEAILIDRKKAFDLAETALQNAESRRFERKAAGSDEESRIDMKAGPGEGKALQGIYRFKGDILTICYDEADRRRPETFAANKSSERLVILRRLDMEKRNEAILKKLDKPIPLRVKDRELGHVLSYIKEATTEPGDTGVPIYVDPAALAKAQVLITTRVTYESEDGEPLKDSLTVVLGRLGLKYRVEDGLLKIDRPVFPHWGVQLMPPHPRDKVIRDRLEERLDLTFEKTPLEEVLKFVKQATRKGPNDNGILIYVDPVGLNKAERTLATPVSFVARGEPLKSSLERLLKSIGLAYMVKDGLLTVTAASDELIPPENAPQPKGTRAPD
jgi:RNA polymerase sigma factor (sigma-70 family)